MSNEHLNLKECSIEKSIIYDPNKTQQKHKVLYKAIKGFDGKSCKYLDYIFQ